jgi:hypothetical protein
MPVTTAARTITDIKGQKSRPRKKADIRKRARKNHKIILWDVLSGIILQLKTMFCYHRLYCETFAKRPFLLNFCVPDERDLRFASTGSNFNPRNTPCIPVVKIIAFLELKQNLTFCKGLIVSTSGNRPTLKFIADNKINSIPFLN